MKFRLEKLFDLSGFW